MSNIVAAGSLLLYDWCICLGEEVRFCHLFLTSFVSFSFFVASFDRPFFVLWERHHLIRTGRSCSRRRLDS